MNLVVQTLANAIVASAFYALIAIGLSLIFGVMNVVNYAHGEFYMLGAYAVWILYGENGWPYFLAVGAAAVIVGLVGIVSERLIFRRVRGNVLSGFLVSIGLVFVLQVLVARIWGVGSVKPVPAALKGALDVWYISVGWQRLLVVPVAAAMIALLFLFLNRLRIGRALRACAQDAEAASVRGMNPSLIGLIAFAVGSAMAGVAGALMAPIFSVTPYMGAHVIWTAFVVVILGGAGQLRGTVLAAVLLGLLNTAATTIWDSTVALIISSAFLLVFLSFRPQGLVGRVAK